MGWRYEKFVILIASRNWIWIDIDWFIGDFDDKKWDKASSIDQISKMCVRSFATGLTES